MAAKRSERRTTWCKPPAFAAETEPSEGPRSVSAVGGHGRSAAVGDEPSGPLAQRANDGLEWLEVCRDINSGIRELAERWRAPDVVFSFLCECGDPECSEAVPLLPRVYAEARRMNEVIAPTHGAPPPPHSAERFKARARAIPSRDNDVSKKGTPIHGRVGARHKRETEMRTSTKRFRLDEMRGAAVHERDGDKIGSVEEIFYDEGSRQPRMDRSRDRLLRNEARARADARRAHS
jgi:hypothetical protein